MGIYFIAAGSKTRNREKSLEKSFSVSEIERFLKPTDVMHLKNSYPSGIGIFVWGANQGRTFNQLSNVSKGEYVVDVKNKVVVQIFKFCFYIDAGNDNRLQEYIGWDREMPDYERRPYKYVFFLKGPQSPGRDQKEKNYFQSAFEELNNSNWLVGQRWFSGPQVNEAITRKRVVNIEGLLGISEASTTNNSSEGGSILNRIIKSKIRNSPITSEASRFIIPDWLKPIIGQIKLLHDQADHQERDHEDIVKELFRVLGYTPIEEIRFQRGRIDILISVENRPLITVEVKRDWSLSESNADYVHQAFHYSHQIGTRFVVLTNGDIFLVFDRTKGFRYEEMLFAKFELTKLDDKGLQSLGSLKKSELPNIE